MNSTVIVVKRFDVHLSSRRTRRARGFTLIEAALATGIVGFGVVSMMQLFYACTQQNIVGSNATSAMLLANNVQEAMASLPFNDPVTGRTTFGPESGETTTLAYDDLDDFDGATFSPPIDSMLEQISDLDRFSQVVSVVPVYPNKLRSNGGATLEISKTTYTGAVRVTVRILQDGPDGTAGEIYRTSWVRVDK